eukprot:scaffold55311_cov60-Cyclotella_meneghiniana.AAC.7
MIATANGRLYIQLPDYMGLPVKSPPPQWQRWLRHNNQPNTIGMITTVSIVSPPPQVGETEVWRLPLVVSVGVAMVVPFLFSLFHGSEVSE